MRGYSFDFREVWIWREKYLGSFSVEGGDRIKVRLRF